MLGRFVRPQSGHHLARGAAFLASCAGFFISAHAALAQSGLNTGIDYATAIGLATGDIRSTIALIINAFFGLLGLLAVILMLYAGYLWMTARGDEEQVEQAKDVMRNAVIGLIIIFSAYAIAFFIFRALTGENLVGGVSVADQTANLTLQIAPPGSGALGNGILATHYPARDQNNVPRNTLIVLTFKQPIALSSVIQGYNDNNTYATADDDPYSGNFRLNTTNIKITPSVVSGGSGTVDAQFTAMYQNALSAGTGITVRFTPVPNGSAGQPFDPTVYQTMTISVPTPPSLGSASAPMNYRVALRGGPNGVRVWGSSAVDNANQSKEAACGALAGTRPEKIQCAFPNLPGAGATGGYYWAFTTSTTLDMTAPKIIGVVPSTIRTPSDGSQLLARNQLLQIYFDEPVDPTTASGIVGSGAFGIDVQSASTESGTFSPVAGNVTMGSQYRIAQFTPSALCEGRSQNACGQPVYCMPANAYVRVIAVPATIDPTNLPQSLGQFDGITDLANNSLDGNGDGVAQGPGSATQFYSLNTSTQGQSTVVDRVRVAYRVGPVIDLTPPTIVNIDPVSYGGGVVESTPYASGPSRVPVSLPIAVVWSKSLDISSLRTGPFENPNTDQNATIALLAKEYRNGGTSPCGASGCVKIAVTDKPSFEAGLEPVRTSTNGAQSLFPNVTVNVGQQLMYITHRIFFRSNDLGWVEGDETDPQTVPKYVPKITAQVRDTTQNCFYPSAGFGCDMGSNTSCCNRTGVASFPGASNQCNPQ